MSSSSAVNATTVASKTTMKKGPAMKSTTMKRPVSPPPMKAVSKGTGMKSRSPSPRVTMQTKSARPSQVSQQIVMKSTSKGSAKSARSERQVVRKVNGFNMPELQGWDPESGETRRGRMPVPRFADGEIDHAALNDQKGRMLERMRRQKRHHARVRREGERAKKAEEDKLIEEGLLPPRLPRKKPGRKPIEDAAMKMKTVMKPAALTKSGSKSARPSVGSAQKTRSKTGASADSWAKTWNNNAAGWNNTNYDETKYNNQDQQWWYNDSARQSAW